MSREVAFSRGEVVMRVLWRGRRCVFGSVLQVQDDRDGLGCQGVRRVVDNMVEVSRGTGSSCERRKRFCCGVVVRACCGVQRCCLQGFSAGEVVALEIRDAEINDADRRFPFGGWDGSVKAGVKM